jgi:type IV secretory pathway component VirB8
MMRPTYEFSDETHSLSLETWEEACALSQQWAEGARLAANKRRRRGIILVSILAISLAIAIIATIAIIVLEAL